MTALRQCDNRAGDVEDADGQVDLLRTVGVSPGERHCAPLARKPTLARRRGIPHYIGGKPPVATSDEKGPHLCGPFCGAAGNRTRVLRHSLKASPCAVRYVSTRISWSRKLARMTIPVAVSVPMSPATELIGGSL
jgi:hypothetical protein